MFALAAPVVVAELGWITMGMVDTLMVGPLGAEAIGAVGLGSALFIAVGIFGMGMLLGLDTLVSQAFGAGRVDECHRWLLHGCVLALLLTVPDDAAAAVDERDARPVGHESGRAAAGPPVSRRGGVERLAAAAVFLTPAIPAGCGRRPAHHDHVDRGEPVERGRRTGS